MGLGGGIGTNPGGIMSRGPTDQNRNNEILNHNYDSINERKISHEEQFKSGIDLYSQFNLNNQKQDAYKNPFQTDHLLPDQNGFKTDPNNLIDYQTKLQEQQAKHVSSISDLGLGTDTSGLVSKSSIASSHLLNTSQSQNDYNPLTSALSSTSTVGAGGQIPQMNTAGTNRIGDLPQISHQNQLSNHNVYQTASSQLTLTCPQCYRQFDSAPFFWYHVSVEHNIYSSFNSLNPLNPLNSNGAQTVNTQQGLHHLPMNHTLHNNPSNDQNDSRLMSSSDHFNFGLPHINPAT